MRIPVLVATAVLAACAGPGAGRHRRAAISDDGRSAILGGVSWRAPAGVSFFERRDELHVVSLVPGSVFDVHVPLDPGGRPLAPSDAPFELKDGMIVLRDRALPPTAKLVDSGQLYPHDDHFHLTHRWVNEDWQALYAAKEDGSHVPAVMRPVAAFLLASLLDLRLPGRTEQATAAAMRRMETIVSRARRGVDAGLPTKQIVAMVLHDFEILDEGRTLSIDGRQLRAAEGVKFAYCGDHFHVEQAGGKWVHPVAVASSEPGKFELPSSVFYEETDGTVAERPGATAWRELLGQEHIHLVGDAWFLSERYPAPGFIRLQRAANDEAVPQVLREAARRSVIDFLKVKLDVSAETAFRSQLATLDQAIDLRWREVEAQIGAARAGRRR